MRHFPRKWWQRPIDWLLGRRWSMGVDVATSAGDKWAYVVCYRDSKGVVHMVECECGE